MVDDLFGRVWTRQTHSGFAHQDESTGRSHEFRNALGECSQIEWSSIQASGRTGGFESNTLVTAIDHGVGLPQRFEMVYQFLSLEHADRVRIRVMTDGDEPEVDTITDLWPGTQFSERECWDLLGVRFRGHENLRRILMPEGFTHHPLRKDFPHIGIEPDRLYQKWDDERRAAFAAGEESK